MSELDGKDFIVSCSDCKLGRESDNFSEVIEFVEKHEEHTDHVVQWIQHSFEFENQVRAKWLVCCSTCAEEWKFGSEEEATEFYNEHSEYTDHSADALNQEEEEVVDVRGLKNVIEQMSSEFENGAPVPLIIEKLKEQGFDEGETKEKLNKFKRMGEVYEPKKGYLRTT